MEWGGIIKWRREGKERELNLKDAIEKGVRVWEGKDKKTKERKGKEQQMEKAAEQDKV